MGSCSTSTLPYSSRVSLLSPGENAFFAALTQAVRGDWLIMSKVRLADIVTCSRSKWKRGFGGAISQKHIDFVLCDKADCAFVLAIELDDRSHDAPHRQERDHFVDGVFATAAVPLLRVRARSHYDVDFIRRLIDWALRTLPLASRPHRQICYRPYTNRAGSFRRSYRRARRRRGTAASWVARMPEGHPCNQSR